MEKPSQPSSPSGLNLGFILLLLNAPPILWFAADWHYAGDRTSSHYLELTSRSWYFAFLFCGVGILTVAGVLSLFWSHTRSKLQDSIGVGVFHLLIGFAWYLFT